MCSIIGLLGLKCSPLKEVYLLYIVTLTSSLGMLLGEGKFNCYNVRIFSYKELVFVDINGGKIDPHGTTIE